MTLAKLNPMIPPATNPMRTSSTAITALFIEKKKTPMSAPNIVQKTVRVILVEFFSDIRECPLCGLAQVSWTVGLNSTVHET